MNRSSNLPHLHLRVNFAALPLAYMLGIAFSLTCHTLHYLFISFSISYVSKKSFAKGKHLIVISPYQIMRFALTSAFCGMSAVRACRCLAVIDIGSCDGSSVEEEIAKHAFSSFVSQWRIFSHFFFNFSIPFAFLSKVGNHFSLLPWSSNQNRCRAGLFAISCPYHVMYIASSSQCIFLKLNPFRFEKAWYYILFWSHLGQWIWIVCRRTGQFNSLIISPR